MEVEGRQVTQPMAETEQTVTADNANNDQGKMNHFLSYDEIQNILKTENTHQLNEDDFKELEVFLEEGLKSPLPLENEPKAANEGQTFDIVKFAVEESGVELDEDEELTEDEPAKTTMDLDEDYIPDLKKIKAEPTEYVEMEPVENVSIEVIEETPRKRRVGRPINHNPITVTEIPRACKLSDNELKALKYQRTRELNNKASRRFRQKKKEREAQELQELDQLRAQNYQLQQAVDIMEKEVALWKAKVSSINK